MQKILYPDERFQLYSLQSRKERDNFIQEMIKNGYSLVRYAIIYQKENVGVLGDNCIIIDAKSKNHSILQKIFTDFCG